MWEGDKLGGCRGKQLDASRGLRVSLKKSGRDDLSVDHLALNTGRPDGGQYFCGAMDLTNDKQAGTATCRLDYRHANKSE